MHDYVIATPYGLAHRVRTAARRFGDALGLEEHRRTWLRRIEAPDVRERIDA